MIRPALIVVEGPTAAGKSTLVEGLRRYYKLPVVHMPADKASDPTDHYVKSAIHGGFPDTGPSRIMDRWVYSNAVYSHVLNNQKAADVSEVERKVLDFFPKVCTIWLHGAPRLLFERARLEGRHDGLGLEKPEVWERIGKEFAVQYGLCELPKIELDSTHLRENELLIASIDFIEGKTSNEQEDGTCGHGCCFTE